jgi:hypothetical protein
MRNTQNMHYYLIASVFALVVAIFVGSATAQDEDFDWAIITDVNNPAYGGGPSGQLAGRGSKRGC